MKRIIGRSISALLALAALLYLAALVMRADSGMPNESQDLNAGLHGTVAVFGATGTIGDGLLKAAMSDPDVDRIHVVSRRPSPRIDEGVASGKVKLMIHMDYQDFSAIQGILADVDTVFWAIGLSAVGLDEETYHEIHTTYPVYLVEEWMTASNKEDLSFHYVSGSGADADSRMMWAREKALAETQLMTMASGTNMRVISYRPAFILPTETEVHLGHRILYAIFAPIKSAVSAQSIGEAMLEVSARGQQVPNGSILENSDIIGYSKAYQDRHGLN